MRLDHLLSTEIQGAVASVGLLVWKRSVALVWYGHAFGFPDRHRAFGSGAVRHTGSRPSPWWGSRVRVPVVVVV